MFIFYLLEVYEKVLSLYKIDLIDNQLIVVKSVDCISQVHPVAQFTVRKKKCFSLNLWET